MHTLHDKVEDKILQHLVRKRLAIVSIHIHEELQEIFLGLVVAIDATALDDIHRKVVHDFFVLDHLLVHSRGPFAELPRAFKQTVKDNSIETVERSRKLDLFLGRV